MTCWLSAGWWGRGLHLLAGVDSDWGDIAGWLTITVGWLLSQLVWVAIVQTMLVSGAWATWSLIQLLFKAVWLFLLVGVDWLTLLFVWRLSQLNVLASAD